MTKENAEAPNDPKESPKRSDRGGAPDVDRSKGPGIDDDSPFGSPKKHISGPEEKPPTR